MMMIVDDESESKVEGGGGKRKGARRGVRRGEGVQINNMHYNRFLHSVYVLGDLDLPAGEEGVERVQAAVEPHERSLVGSEAGERHLPPLSHHPLPFRDAGGVGSLRLHQEFTEPVKDHGVLEQVDVLTAFRVICKVEERGAHR